MCGICFLMAIPINNHHFSWDFIEAYNPSEDELTLPLN